MTVLQLREIGGRPPDRLAQRLQGQAGLAAVVAEPLTEHQGIEDIGRHHARKFASSSRSDASMSDVRFDKFGQSFP